jgi:hypothetical protein
MWLEKQKKRHTERIVEPASFAVDIGETRSRADADDVRAEGAFA